MGFVLSKRPRFKILVEAERLRPNLETLIDLADIIITSKNFPQAKQYKIVQNMFLGF